MEIIKKDKTQRDDIVRLTAGILSTNAPVVPEIDCVAGAGVFVREMRVPAGTVIVGKYHKGDTMNLLTQGKVALLNTDGEVFIAEAPYYMVSGEGSKAAYIIEDCIWINVHPTEETDPDIVEGIFIDETKNPCLEAQILLEKLSQEEIECHI